MAALKSSIILLFFVSSCSLAGDNYKVKFDNTLSRCIDITDKEFLIIKDIPFLSIKFNERKSIGECGCKSAIAAFKVQSFIDNQAYDLIGGKIIFQSKSNVSIPLSMDKSIISNKNLKVAFTCSNPI